MILNFDAGLAKELLDISAASTARRPCLGQLVDPAFWRDDLPRERREALEADAAQNGGFAFSARATDVDPAKIGAGLWLVGDQGVYLMANVPNDEVTGKLPTHIAHAAEVNPETLDFEDWWSAKKASFGGDDGVDFLPEARLRPAIEAALAQGAPLRLDVTPDSLVIQP